MKNILHKIQRIAHHHSGEVCVSLLLCGLMSAWADQPFEKQKAWNGSFESGLDGWDPAIIRSKPGQPSDKDSVEITTEHVRDGRQALQFKIGSWSPSVSIRSTPSPIMNRAPYQRMTSWAFFEGDAGRGFGAKVQLYDANLNPIPDVLLSNTGLAIANNEWFPIIVDFDVPENAVYFSVELFWNTGDGKVTFDDIVIAPAGKKEPTRTGYRLTDRSGQKGELWVASALEKIYPDALKPDKSGTRIDLSAAKGENFSVQLVYKPQVEQRDVSVTCSDFKNSDKNRIIASDCLHVQYVADVTVKQASADWKHTRTGATPDPLFFKAPTVLKAGKPQSFLLTIQVPRDAASGIYEAVLHLKTREVKMDIPLKLEVFDFELPEKPNLKTFAQTFHIDPAARDTLRARSLQYRMTTEISYAGGVQSLEPKLNDDYTVSIDWNSWDEVMEKYFAEGMDRFPVPCLMMGDILGFYNQGKWLTLQYDSPEWNKALADYVRQMYEHLQEKGWLEYAVWQIWDEPMGSKMRAAVKKIAEIVRHNAPEAKIMASGWPVDSSERDIDIWVPMKSLVTPHIREVSKSELGTYDNELYIIDLPYGLSLMRNHAWWMWNQDLKENLWWATCCGWGSDIYNHLNLYPTQNGAGTLFYPDPEGDKTEVMDSLRIVAYRSGINDFDYFTILASEQDRSVEKLGLNEGLPSGHELVKTLISKALNTNDPNLLEETRAVAARLIEFLKDNPSFALRLDKDFWTSRKAEIIGASGPNGGSIGTLNIDDTAPYRTSSEGIKK